jgi:hypothetical protein
VSTIKRFTPTKSEMLWPPPGTPVWPNLPPPPATPPCPVRLGDCKAGDRVLLASGEMADVTYVSQCGVTLRPLTKIERTVYDSKNDREVKFAVRSRGYTVAPSAMCQAVVEHNAPKGENE